MWSTAFALQLNAMANRAAGKGYENTGFYNNVTYQFVGIQNIHIMRESLQKLVEGVACDHVMSCDASM